MSDNRMKKTPQPKRGGGPGGFPMGMPAEKPKDFKGTLKRLLQYIRPFWSKLMIVLILAIFATSFTILGPDIMKRATNAIVDGMIEKVKATASGLPIPSLDFSYIGQILLILLGVYIISGIFSYIQNFVMSSVSQKIVYQMRKDITQKLNKLPLKFYDSNTHGDIMSRVINDVDNIGNMLQQGLTQLITSTVTILGVFIMMLRISGTMTLITIASLPLYLVVVMLVAKKSQKHFIAQQEHLGKLNGHVEEMYSGHKIIKVFGHEEKSISTFKDVNDQLYTSGWKAQFISGIIMPLMNFISNVAYVSVSVIGGIFVAKERLKAGDILAFIQYTRQFSMPIVQTANIANILQSTIASAERVFKLIDEIEEENNQAQSITIREPKGNVVFEDVSFGYTDNLLINHLNLQVKQGQTIAIVGPTGAGKTTLVNLLMRFYEINGGNIWLDGVDIKTLTRQNLRQHFGMVLQDTWLFHGTIKENIGYGKQGATEEEIIAAAKAAHADRFIRTLPKGYDTVLDEDATNISQGQKQLLTIARAILANPTVLILDEATSSVDTRTESYIQNAMTRLMEGRTNFVIAHRLSTIKGADVILVMNNGDIIEQGTHASLLADGGFYHDLYQSQFSGGQ